MQVKFCAVVPEYLMCTKVVIIELEAGVGIGRLKRRFAVKNSHFPWLLKPTLELLAPTLSLHLC
jgi:hypothetical protein